MSTKHLILAWIKKHPSHGYVIKKHYQEFINPSETLNDAKLYPLLSEMEEEGLITKEVDATGAGPARKNIMITDKGVAEFKAWLESDSSETTDRRPRYDFFKAFPFLTKFSFFYELDSKTIARKIDAQLELHRDKLADFVQAREKMVGKGLEQCKVQALDFGIMFEETTLRWLEDMAAFYGEGGTS